MSSAVKERPILFSGEMVRAILDGRKTQTRRVVKDAQGAFWDHPGWTPTIDGTSVVWRSGEHEFVSHGRCPWQAGMRLWVRETWGLHLYSDFTCWNRDSVAGRSADDVLTVWQVAYAADATSPYDHWRPSIHMPRWASRITLEVTGVRVERLQSISADDALGEGVGATSFWKPSEVDENPRPTHEWAEPYWDDFYFWHHYPQRAFRGLWDSINGDRAPWSSNPYVWVVSFRRVQP